MTTTYDDHKTRYSDGQFAQLNKLLRAFIGQPIVIIESDPKHKNFFATVEGMYPYYAGGENYFELGVEREKKFIFSIFNHPVVEQIGAISWEFRNDEGRFEEIDVSFNNKCLRLFSSNELEVAKKNIISLIFEKLNCGIVFFDKII